MGTMMILSINTSPDWIKLLPRKLVVRWFKGMGKKRSQREMITDQVGVDKRPKKINNKMEFGHFILNYYFYWRAILAIYHLGTSMSKDSFCSGDLIECHSTSCVQFQLRTKAAPLKLTSLT